MAPIKTLELTQFYDSFSDAYLGITDKTSAILQSRTGWIPGDFNLNRQIHLEIWGGYDTNFQNVAGRTVVKGMLSVIAGKLTVKNVAVR
jgi:hypothetical protein